jgi:hypothetical protein
VVPTFTVRCPGRLGGQSGAGGAGGAEGDGKGGHSAGGDAPAEAGFGSAVEDDTGLSFVRTDLNQGVPVALNELGQVVAMVTVQSACRSFLVDDQGVRDILVAGDHACTRVNDINDSGFVVGTVDTPPKAFLWHDGVATLFSDVSGTPVAINNSNQVVFDSGQLWEAGHVTELTLPGGELLRPAAMNNAGQIVGISNAASQLAYLWQAGSALELPLSSPSAINDRGHVLDGGPGADVVGIWDGTRLLLRPMPMDTSFGYGVGMNNADEIAATLEPGPGDFPPLPLVSMGSHFTQLRGSAAAYGINDRGDVIGQEYDLHSSGNPRGVVEHSFSPGAGRIWSRRCSLACCPQ